MCFRQILCPIFGYVDTPMQLDILIVGVLFPAIPSMMINFSNRYWLLSGLIRSLHDTVIDAQTLADDSARFFSTDRQLASTSALAGCHSNIFGRRLHPQLISDDFAVSEYQRCWKLAFFLRHHSYDYVDNLIHSGNPDR